MTRRQPDGSDGETGTETGRRSTARPTALGAAAVGLIAAAILWYMFAHGEDGYVTWSRREEADAPDSLVVPTFSRPSDTGGIAPPF